MDVKTLDEIAIANQTDMATVFTRTYAKPHGYTLHLEKFFAPLVGKPIKFIEIGVGGGESIRTWLEYFPWASVFGVDIIQGTNPWNRAGVQAHPRYVFNCADQSDPVFWKCFVANHGTNFDVIVDDGGHEAAQIQATFKSMWRYIVPGGLYCVEDLAYAWSSNLGWIMGLMEEMNHGGLEIKFLYFSRELLVLTKQ